MAVALSETPILSFLNNAGQPNVGGSILTQVGGVNYPTYQDPAGATALPNPIPLNSRGEISNSSGISSQLYLLPGVVYTFTLYDASGNQIWIAEDVIAISPVAVGNMTDEKGSNGLPGFSAANGDFVPGTTASLTLSQNYGSASNLWIAFDAGEQGAGTFSLSGTNNETLTFNAPIPLGTSMVFVKGGTSLSMGTPGNGTVGPAQFSFPLYGPTSGRPPAPAVGQPYFDTTLGYEIVAVASSPAVWNSAGGALAQSVGIFPVTGLHSLGTTIFDDSSWTPGDVANILAFGGIPDGVTDNTVAFNAAVAAATTAAEFTASITGTTLTVDAITAGQIRVGHILAGTGITAGTTVTALVTGTGGKGTYAISASQTVVSEAMTSGYAGGIVYFPPGAFYFASTLTITINSTQTVPGSFSIRGAGSNITKLIFNGASYGGLEVVYGSAFSSCHIEGMSILTSGAASGTNSGIALVQAASTGSGNGSYPITTLRDLEFRGSDGFNETHCWAIGLLLQGVSTINVYDCNFFGPTGTPTGIGIDLAEAPSGASIIPVVFNFFGCNFTHLSVGIQYGGNCQGLSVVDCNMTANFTGILVPSGSSTPDQLSVTASQLNNINFSIFCQGVCQAVTITENLILIEANSVGILFNQAGQSVIVGNSFGPSSLPDTNMTGISVGTYNQGATIITGNYFDQISLGINLVAGSSHVNVQSNAYSPLIGTAVTNSGSGNTIGGGSQ